MWGNQSEIFNQNDINQTPVLTNVLIEGGCLADLTCTTTVITTDPQFLRDPEDGADDDWLGLADNDYGDLRLALTSPAINQGENDFVVYISSDLDGKARVVDATVELGAYE